MTDVHCHLQFQAFENDYDAVIMAASDAGVTRIINVGTKIDSSQKAVEFALNYENLYAIIGVHPHHADKVLLNSIKKQVSSIKDYSLNTLYSPLYTKKGGWLEKLEMLAKNKKVLAIGEIGLDYYSYQSNGIVEPVLQKKVFIEQLELAHSLKLPLQIHNRHAGEDILEILETHKHLLQNQPGMFHCFAGSKDVLKRALSLGFCIGFDGNITYKGLAPGETVSLSELASLTPLDRIVIETDSPYLTPIPHRGKRNEPKHAIITAEFVAGLKGISFEELVEQTERNVYNIFGRLKKNF